MRVADLIEMLHRHQDKHGPNAQIFVPCSAPCICGCSDQTKVGGVCREEIFLHDEPIATYLDSRGEEIEW